MREIPNVLSCERETVKAVFRCPDEGNHEITQSVKMTYCGGSCASESLFVREADQSHPEPALP